MGETKLQKLINENYQKLPPIVQNFVTESDWLKILEEILQDNSFSLEQNDSIEMETLLMLIGVSNPKEYALNIKKEANLTIDEAISVAEEVNDKIYQKLIKKIITESEKQAGLPENPLKEILGEDEEILTMFPQINLDLEEDEEDQRKELVGELSQDIQIDSNEEVEDELMIIDQETKTPVLENIPTKPQQQSELLPEENKKELDQNKVPPNKVPLRKDQIPNPRIIQSSFTRKENSLPDLQPLRTLEKDSERFGHPISEKLSKETTQRAKSEEASIKQDEATQKTEPSASIVESVPKSPASEKPAVPEPTAPEKQFVESMPEKPAPEQTQAGTDPYREPIE